MKIALRIVISGLIVALIVVLCVFVFFKPNNALTAYNTLNDAFKETGAIGIMENKIDSSQSQLNTVLVHYDIVQQELNTLQLNYPKMRMYESEHDASDSLNKKVDALIKTVKKFNDEVDNYILTKQSGASGNSLVIIETKLNNQVLTQVNLLSELNVLVFNCLNDGFYKDRYSYSAVLKVVASIKSVNINNEDQTVMDANKEAYFNIINKSNSDPCEPTFEGSNKFLTNVWDLDIVRLIQNSESYIDGLTEEEQVKAEYVLSYIQSIEDMEGQV